ncbi:hypothetical protein CMI47_08200 [Candidatus Pacearchaeota archaeon]|nr:hypothetical protein [Candidatus Pacearchaeota archaeon]|tara:strand:- start:2097 stop:4472 length:2376 start_codon:yes stop_codon:yes gene_type:complete
MGDFGDQNDTSREINATLGQINQKLKVQLSYQLLIAKSVGKNVDDLIDQGEALGLVMKNAGKSASSLEDAGSSLTNVAEGLLDTIASIAELPVATIKAVDTLSEYHGEQFLKILDDFGGGLDFINNATTLESQRMVDITQGMISNFYDFSEEATKIQGSSLFTIFDSSEEMMKSFYAAISGRGTEAYDLLRSTNENIALDMALTQKELGFNQEQLETLIAREVDLTGEATGQMLREVIAFSNSVGKETGIASKRIAANVELIIRDTEKFGNVSTAEATRISAALIEVGIRYDELSGAVGQFQSYEQAATAVGNLTSVFGIHMDAMEMMTLANTDQEQFLMRMREQLLGAGLDIDTLTIAEKNLLKTQLGFGDVGAVERFLDPSNVVTSFEDLQSASDPSLVKDNVSDLVESIRPMDDAAEILRKFETHLSQIATSKIASGIANTRMEISKLIGVSGGAAVQTMGEVLGDISRNVSMTQSEALGTMNAEDLERELERIAEIREEGNTKAADARQARIDSMISTQGAIQDVQDQIGELNAETRTKFDDALRYIEKRTEEGVSQQGSSYREMAINMAIFGRETAVEMMKSSDDVIAFTDDQLRTMAESGVAIEAQTIRRQADFASDLMDMYRNENVTFSQLNEEAVNSLMEETGMNASQIKDLLSSASEAGAVIEDVVSERTSALLGQRETIEPAEMNALHGASEAGAVIEGVLNERTADLTRQRETIEGAEPAETAVQNNNEIISQTAEAVTSAIGGRPIHVTVELDSRVLADAIIQNPVGTDNITIMTSQIA